MAVMDPRGMYLCIPAEEDLQPAILKRLEKWRKTAAACSRS
jgi:hypothetical protein